MSKSGSTCSPSPRESGLPGLWMRVKCAWANFQRLVSHYFFPLKFHPVFPPESSNPGALLLLRSWEAALLGRRLQLGTPAPVNLDSWWLYPGPEGQPPSLGGTRDSGSSQGKPDSAGLTGVSMKGTSWPVSTPPQSSPGTWVYSGSRNEISAHVKEVAGYKLVIPFL